MTVSYNQSCSTHLLVAPLLNYHTTVINSAKALKSGVGNDISGAVRIGLQYIRHVGIILTSPVIYILALIPAALIGSIAHQVQVRIDKAHTKFHPISTLTIEPRHQNKKRKKTPYNLTHFVVTYRDKEAEKEGIEQELIPTILSGTSSEYGENGAFPIYSNAHKSIDLTHIDKDKHVISSIHAYYVIGNHANLTVNSRAIEMTIPYENGIRQRSARCIDLSDPIQAKDSVKAQKALAFNAALSARGINVEKLYNCKNTFLKQCLEGLRSPTKENIENAILEATSLQELQCIIDKLNPKQSNFQEGKLGDDERIARIVRDPIINHPVIVCTRENMSEMPILEKFSLSYRGMIPEHIRSAISTVKRIADNIVKEDLQLHPAKTLLETLIHDLIPDRFRIRNPSNSQFDHINAILGCKELDYMSFIIAMQFVKSLEQPDLPDQYRAYVTHFIGKVIGLDDQVIEACKNRENLSDSSLSPRLKKQLALFRMLMAPGLGENVLYKKGSWKPIDRKPFIIHEIEYDYFFREAILEEDSDNNNILEPFTGDGVSMAIGAIKYLTGKDGGIRHFETFCDVCQYIVASNNSAEFTIRDIYTFLFSFSHRLAVLDTLREFDTRAFDSNIVLEADKLLLQFEREGDVTVEQLNAVSPTLCQRYTKAYPKYSSDQTGIGTNSVKNSLNQVEEKGSHSVQLPITAFYKEAWDRYVKMQNDKGHAPSPFMLPLFMKGIYRDITQSLAEKTALNHSTKIGYDNFTKKYYLQITKNN